MADTPDTAFLLAENRRLRQELAHFQKHPTPEGRDITDRHRVEEQFFLNTIIDAIGDPLFVKDRDHRWIVLNRALCGFVGFSREELLGKSDYDFFPAEQASIFWSKDEEVFQSLEENINEEEITDATGKTHVISTRKSAFEDDTGQRFLVGVIRDITELKESERKLQTNIRYLNSIIENLPLCVKLIDKDGTILDMNPAGLAMIGMPAGISVAGRKIDPFIHPEDLQTFLSMNAEICGGASRSYRFRMIDLAGGIHIMESIAVPIPRADGKGLLQLGLTRDLTETLQREMETRALETQLQQARKMEAIGTLAGGIAHDFNNILTAILGYAELVHLQLEDAGMRRNLEQIISAGIRARDLVKQILTFSRRHREDLRPQLLQTILHEAMQLLRASIPTSIEIVEQIDGECGPVLAVASQIHQIVMNLCTNAYLAMREKGGRLRVALRQREMSGEDAAPVSGLEPGDYILLEVEDSGVGMPPEVVQRIFEPYFTTRGKDEGTGLGLSVVHGIVTGHGGGITVDSSPGRGTLFSVYFPRAAISPLPAGLRREDAPRGHERLLVVDDEEMLAGMLQQMLEQLGYRVTSFSSSPAALLAFQADPLGFDLVVTDMTMPQMTGDELAREMFKIRPELPVFICTGYSDRLDPRQAKAAGIRDVLPKPILLHDLARAIRRALG